MCDVVGEVAVYCFIMTAPTPNPSLLPPALMLESDASMQIDAANVLASMQNPEPEPRPLACHFEGWRAPTAPVRICPIHTPFSAPIEDQIAKIHSALDELRCAVAHLYVETDMGLEGLEPSSLLRQTVVRVASNFGIDLYDA
jgi:hypothetical protein